jgi:hypothetical protein
MSAIDKLIAVCKSDLDDEMLDLALEAERELASLRAIEKAGGGLVVYRRRVGPLNFQLEKADYFIDEIRNAFGGEG